jgi:hypothetical protein
MPSCSCLLQNVKYTRHDAILYLTTYEKSSCETTKVEGWDKEDVHLPMALTAYNTIVEWQDKEGWQQHRIVDSTMLTLTVHLNHVSRWQRNKSSGLEHSHSRSTITPLGRMALKAQSSTVRMPRRLPQLGGLPRLLAPWFSSVQMQPLTR